MIEIRATTLAQNLKNLAKLRKKVGETADKRFRQKLFYLFERAVKVTPQYSGDWASNWHILVEDAAGKPYKMLPMKADMQQAWLRADGAIKRFSPRHAGHPVAVTFAMARARAALGKVTRTSKVRLYNPTPLSTDGQNVTGLDGTKALRPYNVIPDNLKIESYLRAVAKGVK